MPHIKLECSSNLDLDSKKFFEELSQKLVETGHASKMGIKCRRVNSIDHYIIDGNPDYKMVNLLFRLREGRSEEVLEEFSSIGMSLLKKYFEADVDSKTIILSTEVKELKKGRDITFNAIR